MWQYLVYNIHAISSLSYFEYISIVGHYNRLLYKEQIDPQLLTRGFTPEQLEQMMAHKNKGPKELISCNIHFKGSMDKWVYPQFDYVFTLFNQYSKHGILPYPGALVDQPAKSIEILELLEQLDTERKVKEHNEQQREQAKASRGNKRR